MIYYRRIFRFEGKLYETKYRAGKMVYEDDHVERPYEGVEDTEIECPEVIAREKTIIEYELKEVQP